MANGASMPATPTYVAARAEFDLHARNHQEEHDADEADALQ
jgi:hypothetical protein